ncbi:MAG: hypothetical protein AAFY15_04100 [Cyanobacteria bacterium J06648_11]
MQVAKDLLDSGPQGGTPLTEALTQVRLMIEEVAGTLREDGQLVTVVITTDGLPQGGSGPLVQEMRILERLPVHILVRLCTSEDDVISFWNAIDAELETPLDVLDDFSGEAEEVAKHQPWLSYGMPLQIAREFGLHDKYFDLLDERPLLLTEARLFLGQLLGVDLPDPHVAFRDFLGALDGALQAHKPVFNCSTARFEPWVNLRAFEHHFAPAGRVTEEGAGPGGGAAQAGGGCCVLS